MAITVPTRVPLGFANAYIVPLGDDYILVDAGDPGGEERFRAFLDQHGIDPRSFHLIIVTHVHFDHVGSLRGLARMTGACVLTTAPAARILETGRVPTPAGLTLFGKVLAAFFQAIGPRARYAPYKSELVVTEETSLAPYGVDGRVLPTSGHTVDSLSLLMANGDAFVGDVAFGWLPFGRGSRFPVLGNDRAAVYQSWQRLLEAGAKCIYPGHGQPFAAAVLAKQLARRA